MRMNIKAISIASGLALLLGVFDWPYGYFVLLRWFVSISAAVVAWKFFESKLNGWSLAFGAIALLFNPLIPVYLNRASWIPIDFISAILFFLAAYSYKRTLQSEQRK